MKHQLDGAFPELVTVWKDIFAPGVFAVLRLGMTPVEIAATPLHSPEAASNVPRIFGRYGAVPAARVSGSQS